ncbi:Glycos_transf_1 domain-containing protein [Cephalotus follicularis]|uniref:Glycos_transf_1 domain-containing protein n=1 Tax=Cephalotus follicularis TaxID=3775 RepID=A0A1Q3C576_CEPFO|nr:Glycos_transf_1 domain-containing protein [Cephalotus follicularis]
MGSLESGVPLKRESLFGSSSATRRPGSRFCRFLLFKKLDYLQWISTVLVFLFFLVWFPMFLPGLVMDKSHANDVDYGNLMHLKEIGGFDFGEDIVFEPSMLLEKFHREAVEFNLSASFNGTRRRFGYRKPQLALVFPDLLVDPQQLLMVTVASALQEIGYEIQIYSFEDGPVHEVWKNMGIPVTIVQTSHKMEIVVDWLNYDGIIVNSLEATGIFSRLMQEPFKSVPLIWTIHEKALALCLREYNSRGQIALVNDWKKVFNRATVVVFPNYALPIIYSAFDAGNYYVIPGSPVEAWKANTITELHKDDLRVKMGYGPEDFVIAIVGSQFLYKGLWLEHALVLQALLPLFADFSFEGNSSSHLKVLVLSGDSTGNYSVAVEAIARNLKYPRGTVKFISVDVDANIFLSTADAVIYGSFLEEKSFPQFLIKAMCFGKPIIAPDLSIIRKYVDDRVNGFLFPKENIEVLTRIMLIVISNGKLSPLSLSVASIARATAKNLMVSETVEGYASLLKSVIKLPSEVAAPKSVKEIQPKLKEEWCWHLFEAFKISAYEARMLRSSRYIKKIEEQWNHTQRESSGSKTALDDSFFYDIWEEQKFIEVFNSKKRREEEELKDRTDQTRGTWEEVYRSAKRADRTKNDLHERDEGELERTGQPLCLYEPYFGEGTWSFLHLNSLYRGIGLSTRGRRPGTDDIDAPSRLPLLSNPYYRDALGEYGAFFAISNRIDRIHKNAWIGFQSWRATARKESLSRIAEYALIDAIQSRKNGDTLYFWVRMDMDPRNPLQQDFWSFCDAINAGNCKFAFSEALRRMYGIQHNLDSLPPMPGEGDTWSVMLSWALPTRSFLEFVMFSRMFVDALDAQMYDEHHQNGHCYLSFSKDKFCYSRLLEVLVNVWAYHSARRMVYVNPETGMMQEQHNLKSRRGKMWIKWFSYTTLKSMDEDLAEEADSDHSKRHWLWPSTGEVVWQGVFEKERNLRNRQKEKRKQLSKEKLARMKKRHGQKAIGKYVKPPPEDIEISNTTMFTSRK